MVLKSFIIQVKSFMDNWQFFSGHTGRQPNQILLPEHVASLFWLHKSSNKLFVWQFISSEDWTESKNSKDANQ